MKFQTEYRLNVPYNYDEDYTKILAQLVRADKYNKEVSPMEKRVAKVGYEDLFELINTKIETVEAEIRKQVEEKTLKLQILLDEVSDIVVEEEPIEEEVKEEVAGEETVNQ